MMVSFLQVKKLLSVDAPNYPAIAERGTALFKHLIALIGGKDAALAAKAAYLATMIDDPQRIRALEMAAEHQDPVVRVVAAANAKRVPSAYHVAEKLTQDLDGSVARLAIESTQALQQQPSGLHVLGVASSEVELNPKMLLPPITDGGVGNLFSSPDPVSQAPFASLPAGLGNLQGGQDAARESTTAGTPASSKRVSMKGIGTAGGENKKRATKKTKKAAKRKKSGGRKKTPR